MIESELISEVVAGGGHGLTGIRIGRDPYVALKVSDPHSRPIFRVDDLILKFDLRDGNGNQSLAEAKLWLRIWPEDRKYFVEVTSTGSAKDQHGNEWRWVAQKYVEEVANPPDNLPAEVIEAANQKVGQLIERYDIGDLHRDYPRNWTIIGTDPLIFDYGIAGKE